MKNGRRTVWRHENDDYVIHATRCLTSSVIDKGRKWKEEMTKRRQESEKTIESCSFDSASYRIADIASKCKTREQCRDVEDPPLCLNEQIHQQHTDSTFNIGNCNSKKETPIQTVSFLLEGTFFTLLWAIVLHCHRLRRKQSRRHLIWITDRRKRRFSVIMDW